MTSKEELLADRPAINQPSDWLIFFATGSAVMPTANKPESFFPQEERLGLFVGGTSGYSEEASPRSLLPLGGAYPGYRGRPPLLPAVSPRSETVRWQR